MFNLLGKLMNSGPRLDPASVVREVTEGKALLIDVREEDEVRFGGKAKGALNLPLSRLQQSSDPKSGHFDKTLAKAHKAGTPVYVYCASGARSSRAASVMRTHGFNAVHNLGNLSAWHAGGGAVVR